MKITPDNSDDGVSGSEIVHICVTHFRIFPNFFSSFSSSGGKLIRQMNDNGAAMNSQGKTEPHKLFDHDFTFCSNKRIGKKINNFVEDLIAL